MAQNEPQRKETPPNSPSLLFEYQCRSGKFIRLANRIESKKIDSAARIESKLFCRNWNALPQSNVETSLSLTNQTFSGFVTMAEAYPDVEPQLSVDDILVMSVEELRYECLRKELDAIGLTRPAIQVCFWPI